MGKSLVYIFIATMAFATLEPVSKLIANEVSPFFMTCIRFIIGGLILIPFSIAKLRRLSIKLGFTDFLKLGLLGVLCVCISMPLLQYGVLKSQSPALIAIIVSSSSVFTVIFAAVFLREKITGRKISAILLCLCGILVCFDWKSGTNIVSVLLAFSAAITFSFYTVMSKKLAAKIPGIIQNGFSFLTGSAVLLLALIVSGVQFTFEVNLKDVMVLSHLGIGVTGIGYWAYFKAMENSSAMAASLVLFMKPVLTPFLSFFITGTPFTVQTFAALALVLAGSLLAMSTNVKTEQTC